MPPLLLLKNDLIINPTPIQPQLQIFTITEKQKTLINAEFTRVSIRPRQESNLRPTA